MGQWITGLVIVALVAGGVYWFSMNNQVPAMYPQGDDQTMMQKDTMAPSSLPTASSDTSKQAIDQDTAAIDAQLNALDQDNTSISEGVKGAQSQQ